MQTSALYTNLVEHTSCESIISEIPAGFLILKSSGCAPTKSFKLSGLLCPVTSLWPIILPASAKVTNMSLSTAYSESLSSPRSCASMLSLPLSLQDTCRLHITMCLDEFQIEMLSLLPLKIRRRLLNGLACVDVLHLEGTPVTNGMDLDFNGLRRDLLKDLLRCSCLQDMFSINFIQDQDELLPYWHKEKGKEIPNEYIASIYQSCCNWHGPHRFL